MKKISKQIKNIDSYIQTFPGDVQVILKKIRNAIKAVAPKTEEAIKYQMPAFVLNGNLVFFAAYEKHIGFYPIPSGVAKFKKDFAKYKTGKGSIQFPLDKPIPISLIKKVVAFRVKENLAKQKVKK